MRTSFTGTRSGMTDWQLMRFEEIVGELAPELFVHGNCVGADEAAHRVVRKLFPATRILVYPSTLMTTQADCAEDADFLGEARPPLERNREIVDVGRDLLIACPRTVGEELRSGTWACVRYARKKRRVRVPTLILWPDGKLQFLGDPRHRLAGRTTAEYLTWR